MNIRGIQRRSLLIKLLSVFSLSVTSVVGVLCLSGCGSANNTYSPTVKSGGVQPAFTVAVSPGSVSVTPGNTANYTVTITETGGFNSPITLSASGLPTGATATFGNLTPTASGATATLAIATTNTVAVEESVVIANSKLAKPVVGSTGSRQATPTGSSTITVSAVGGGITQTANTTLVVTTAPDFSITLTPATVGSNIVAPGGTAKFIATVTSIAGFSTPVALSLTGLPQTTSAIFGSTTVTPTAAGATTTINVTTSFSEGATTLPGAYTLTLTGTAGTTVHTTTVGLNVGAFSISVTEASPGSGTVIQGGTARFLITVTSINGFAPLATLTMPALPTGCTATFGTQSLTPTTAGATTTLTITTTGPAGATPTPVGSLDFDVGAQGGGWDTAGSAQLNVTPAPTFTITATPTSGSTVTGNNIQYTVTVTSIGGFSSPVTLSQTGVPATGTTVTFAPQPITPTPAGVTTIMTISSNDITTPFGTFPVTITGANGALSHTAAVSLTFIDG